MTPEALRELLAADGHADHAEVAAGLLQPSFRVVGTKLAGSPRWKTSDDGPDPIAVLDAAIETLPIGASRFGGIPDLPPGVAWPDRAGQPMEFIAQISLADVPADPLERLPRGGTLLFFQNSQWETFDYDGDHGCCAVLYHAGPPGELVRTTPPPIEFESQHGGTQVGPFVHGLASLRFELTTTVPAGKSPYLPEALAGFWYDFVAAHDLELGGSDSWADNRLLGYLGGDDYVEAHANGTKDQLLLQVDSDGSADFEWGDCDRLYFMLTKAELEARDFSRVRLYSLLG